MNVEDQFQKARSKLLEADGKSICVQALWDGDTSGWFLNLSVVLEHGWFLSKKYKELYLSSISKVVI